MAYSKEAIDEVLAYFSYRHMFDELKRHADFYGCQFLLYVDDLTISSGARYLTRILLSS